MRCQLTQQHRARRVEPAGNDAVMGRHVIDPQLGMAGRADAGGVVDVLQRMRDAMECPPIAASFQLRVGALRLGQREVLGQ